MTLFDKPDIDTVIKGLECCSNYGYNCEKCPYYDKDDEEGCHGEILRYHAAKLLKEYKQDKALLKIYTDRTEKALHEVCANCVFVDGDVCKCKDSEWHEKGVFLGGTCRKFTDKAVEQNGH